MTQIDTSKWEKFRVGDLFEIKPTKSYKMRNADLLDGGNTPVVVNSAFNNGIGGFTTQEPTEKGGIITFSDTVDANTIFYQEKPFAGYSHVQGVYPVGEWANEWDKYSLLFFASCFKSTALRYGFDYSNKFRRDVALELKVLLPQTPDHTPDFDYMENYIKEITKLAAKKVEKVKEEKPQTKIDTSKWKNFSIGELFEIAIGKNYPSSIRQAGELPLVSTTAKNNGISDYIKDRNDGVYSNCITVACSGSVGATFYHEEKVFVGAAAIALLPKFKMNQYSGLFICSILSKINSKFSYIEQIKASQYKNETIPLPVTPNMSPDWQFMENYMKEITKLAAKRVEKVKEEKPQTKIDTSKWKKFKIGELFECNIAKSLDFGKLAKGNTIFIGRTSTNNGVQGKVNAPPCEKGNCITVSMVGDNKAFYQPKEFAASQNILVLRNKSLNERNSLFFVALINSLLAKYNYSNTVKKKEFINETIPLPITPEGAPDFNYMEEYIKNIMKQSTKKIKEVKEICGR